MTKIDLLGTAALTTLWLALSLGGVSSNYTATILVMAALILVHVHACVERYRLQQKINSLGEGK